jgi:hypothetical protein
MKKLLLLLCMLFMSSLAGFCPMDNTITIAKFPPYKPLERLWEATIAVESSNNPHAFNQKEKAIGIVQIRPIRLKDFNKRTGKHYKPIDCYNIKISKEIWSYYANKFPPNDYESISRSWNGKGRKTSVYWGKIKKHLKYLENKNI